MLCHQGHHVHTWKIIHHDPREHWLHGSKLKAIFPEPSRIQSCYEFMEIKKLMTLKITSFCWSFQETGSCWEEE
jgi:hypothetical protein